MCLLSCCEGFFCNITLIVRITNYCNIKWFLWVLVTRKISCAGFHGYVLLGIYSYRVVWERLTVSLVGEFRVTYLRQYSRNFDIKDDSHSDRPVTKKVDEIIAKIKLDRYVNSHEITEKRNLMVLNQNYKNVWKPQKYFTRAYFLICKSFSTKSSHLETDRLPNNNMQIENKVLHNIWHKAQADAKEGNAMCSVELVFFFFYLSV